MILYPKTRADIEQIKAVVSEAYGVEPERMLEPRRKDAVYMVPRMVAMTIGVHAGYSTTYVAWAFKRGDHTNVLNAKRNVFRWMKENPNFAQSVSELCLRCGLEPIEVAA